VNKQSVFRSSAVFLLLVVLFTQAGLSLLHTHQGMPDCHPVALQSDTDNSASCQVCALDAVMDAEPSSVTVIHDVPSPFQPASFVSGEAPLLFSARLKGRAPPVC
jgi:hypothetical protein